ALDYTVASVLALGLVVPITALTVNRLRRRAEMAWAERERLLRAQTRAQAEAEALAEANQRMDEFLGIASHELRTPLTSIKLAAQVAARQLAREVEVDAAERAAILDATRDRLARIDGQIGRLDRLVGDLLDASRIQAGRLEPRPAPCDLAALVHEVVAEHRQLWPERAILLDPPARPVAVVADAERISQVLANYLTNALKYAPADRPITVALALEGATARVSVRDEGPGLPPHEQVRIWERFQRARDVTVQSTMETSGGGLGLGLYISRTIIEHHGGQVGVESAPGAGSTFWFTLARAPVGLLATAGTSDAPSAAHARRPDSLLPLLLA
nr:HAMP domain-containing histidine kinase [Ktedonobacterales bacterium]